MGCDSLTENCENTHRKVTSKSNKNDKNYTDIPNRHCNIHTLNHYSKLKRIEYDLILFEELLNCLPKI